MDLGIHVCNFTYAAGPESIAKTLGAVAEATEAIGASHLSVMDHFFQLQMIGGPERDMLEGYTTLGYLAAKTSTVAIGLLVTGVTYRHPGLLAKIVTTADILSGGRAELGIGAAWYEREHAGLGVPFPAIGERLERLEETLQICKQMWSDDNGPFEGKHFQLAETRNVPQPLQKPHPPILIGGMGEKVLLRLVARYADACNLFSQAGVDGIEHKLDVLRRHCDNENRDYDRIRKTLLWIGESPVGDSAEAFVKKAEAFGKLGIEEMIVIPIGDDPAAWVGQLAPAAKRLKELG